jgi:mycofactocin precursor
VLAARTERDRGRHRDPGATRRSPARDGDRDPGIGVERQVRPMLFERAKRHDQRTSLSVVNLNPIQVSEICHRVLNYRARSREERTTVMSATREQLENAPAEAEPDEDTATAPTEDELVVEDLLVEDISIDGMCGVY